MARLNGNVLEELSELSDNHGSWHTSCVTMTAQKDDSGD